jgi:phenylpropionate dioxygenase-like ring-hydroxylating dioxygenase large terminal subunit
LQHVSRFIRNAWYMAAWSEELTDQLLSRRVFDRQIVLFRRKDGAAQALADRCPHRFAPLSRGTRDGDAIVCAYHGLRFDGSGRCVRNPYADAIPHQAQVDSWAVVERHDILWLWGGTTGTADPALIPDFSPVAESSQVHAVRGYTLLRAPYEYGIDNLMDLSHIEFVHRGSFAGNGVIFAGTHRVREEGAAIHSDWWMPDVAAPSHTRGIYPPDMRCDHWLDMRWDAPASMALQVGSTPKGRPREEGIAVDQAHILTPATADTTHYFWASARRYELDSKELDGMLRTLFQQAFDEEDKPIIQAAYENLEGTDFWDAKPISLGVDAGGLRVRRRLKALLAREQDSR